jgi:hypothetical protein
LYKLYGKRAEHISFIFSEGTYNRDKNQLYVGNTDDDFIDQVIESEMEAYDSYIANK